MRHHPTLPHPLRAPWGGGLRCTRSGILKLAGSQPAPCPGARPHNGLLQEGSAEKRPAPRGAPQLCHVSPGLPQPSAWTPAGAARWRRDRLSELSPRARAPASNPRSARAALGPQGRSPPAPLGGGPRGPGPGSRTAVAHARCGRTCRTTSSSHALWDPGRGPGTPRSSAPPTVQGPDRPAEAARF